MSAVNRDYEIAAAVYPDPRKLYEKDEWYYEDPYRKYRGAALGFVFGILTKMANNYVKDRPLRAGNLFWRISIASAVELQNSNSDLTFIEK